MFNVNEILNLILSHNVSDLHHDRDSKVISFEKSTKKVVINLEQDVQVGYYSQYDQDDELVETNRFKDIGTLDMHIFQTY